MGSSQVDVIASIEAEMHAALSAATAASALQARDAQSNIIHPLSSGDVGTLPFDLAAEVQALKASSQEFDAEGSVASLGDFMAHASLVQPDSLAGFPSFKTMCPTGKGLHRGGAGDGNGSSSSSGRRSSGRGSGSGSGSGLSASDGSDVTSPSPKAARTPRKTERTRGPAGVVPVTKVTGGVARSTLFGSGLGGSGGGAAAAAAPSSAVTGATGAGAAALASAPAASPNDWDACSADGGSKQRFSTDPLDGDAVQGKGSPSAKSGSPPSSFGSSKRRSKMLAKLMKPFKKGDVVSGRGGHAHGSGKDDASQPPSL